jgi:hypothetical protein
MLSENIMSEIAESCCRCRFGACCATVAIFTFTLLVAVANGAEPRNLFKNPGVEDGSDGGSIPAWATREESAGKATVTQSAARTGSNGLFIPANTAVERRIEATAGAYLARCWVKSEIDQTLTLLLQDPDRPWSAYTCEEAKVHGGQWVQLQVFCALDREGSLSFTLGGLSKEFRLYHGNAGEMSSPIVADDFELVRYEPTAARAPVTVWHSQQELSPAADRSAKAQWSVVEKSGQPFSGTLIAQGRQILGSVRKSDGGLNIYTEHEGTLRFRCVVVPSPPISESSCTMVNSDTRTGIRVSSASGDRTYTAWFTTNGVVSINATNVPLFHVQNVRLRHGLLPSFAGTDICYSAAKMTGINEFNIPSTQWFVGLVDGYDSMFVAVWESTAQRVSLGLTGEGPHRVIDSMSIGGTESKGFSLSFVEHAHLWHEQALNEDWLGEYTPIDWKRPFEARWMGQFSVTTGHEPTLRDPCMDYSFPVACTKTRMWGVWFEDWNHYPFFFDGQRTIVHFEKTFIPNGNALFYFLEPAAADLVSPVEIVQQVLGPEKSFQLLDLDANRLRKLKYSTPDQFMYDRPVCATTTRLSKVKKAEKPTVGIDLATHLYEFIREIRGRVDQYEAFFNDVSSYLAKEKTAHSDITSYAAELELMIAEAKAKSKAIYATPLSDAQRKVDGIKKRLQEGTSDGFDCAELDVRDTAGAQDDLCRRYNRWVLRLAQTAALKCGDSPEKAIVAQYIWEQSRAVVRQPTRWESRRTLYFFEP